MKREVSSLSLSARILGLILSLVVSAAGAQDPAGPKNGTIVIRLEMWAEPGVCVAGSYNPEIRIDGKVVSWGSPNLSRMYDTGNPRTRGQALEVYRVTEARHNIVVALPTRPCEGYVWQPNTREVTLTALNGYRATANFSYLRLITPPSPGGAPGLPPPTR